MLGYEPPQPKLWKAVLGAGLITFPFLYIADFAIMRHQPGWIYVAVATLVTLFLGWQMYRKGPQGLRRIPFGAQYNKIYGGESWQPPERHEARDTD